MESAALQEIEIEAQPQRGRGRPAIITLPLTERVARLIAKGMTEEQACIRVGVNHASLRTARHRNPEFETAIKRAQAEFLDESLDVIAKGTRGWQGRAWILERRHGDQFRRTTGMELTGQLGTWSREDLLARKPLSQWCSEDVDQSLGAWRLLRTWPNEQLEQLLALYDRAWGPPNNRTDEQLDWTLAIHRRVIGDEDWELWQSRLGEGCVEQTTEPHEPGELPWNGNGAGHARLLPG